MAKQEKTNVMRTLDRLKIPYADHYYGDTGAVSGVEVARALGEDPACTFKTLVTVGKSRNHFVFMIPVAEELDLKKAAAAVGEKAVEMIKSKELLPLTGYIHGGCSPIGMKKPFPTFIHFTAEDCGTILFSAGKIGYQVECTLADLRRAIPVTSADLTV
ncbi:MAG: aminoacyl-tRNA deacylase [Clostridia bacterium]|nr:aminoacyl-tRNA deacylase [Clostridia bacterium]